MTPRALMIQGTGSDVGKSLIVAGLARAFARRGLRVRPFKPQNMSNNAAVTPDGGEIGRAQALQARAAGVAPSVHMNPVLLKPQSEIGAQVVVQGRMAGTARAREYQAWKPRLMGAVLDSFARLSAEADLVLVEGAGSASEVNLRAGDIANMGFARASLTPVVLLGDIDRGGVIASLVGTRAVLDPQDAALVRGFLVNRFRGDPSLFAEGMELIAARTGWPSLGLVPHFPEAARLPAEDVLGLRGAERPGGRVVAVPVLPRIANFDDLDPLRAEPGVSVVLVEPGTPLPAAADLVLLPGSKTTIPDLHFLRAQGWDIDLKAHVRRGGRVLGLCGGYQMLGTRLSDPHGIEGEPGEVEGLGLLDVATVMTPDKRLAAVTGTSLPEGTPFRGYEMHIGETAGPDAARPLLRLADGRPDGAVSPDGRVCGTYVHGLFADDRQRALWLARLGAAPGGEAYEAGIEAVLDRLADHLERHVACDRLLAIAREGAVPDGGSPAAMALPSGSG
ncbi:cobyric acid synthase [Methylobacterium isbiliense]|uniref:Cobyric acid synthase n=1 Tax=Methylobacterium isbiliense TaxID=315478 RepID=A0ABQ4SEK9_9HYPH|nr:cobyric acid synthase [Methylobacterium isbiliense]MDN3626898.1 cobyric acid synthase [Methylobacterium isbiliense]GJE00204.1 Cobyric acid synthase [Methylobacterium isbiliense]